MVALATGATLTSLTTTEIHAATQHHRLIWDSDPAHNAVIAFSPSGTSNNPYLRFGGSTNESEWTTKQVSASRSFDGSLLSHFVRLDNLNANSAVYYRVCDQDGCGDRFWFQTAPIDDSPYVVIAGGDTRTGWTNRRMGNDLVAKIRPLFIMHGGDFTNANSASEMRSFLTDWSRTYSSDQIDGVSYKRIYPLIPTHGNHEDDNYSTLCQVFGVDYNQDGSCNPGDTYGAFNISPLLRVYTLNSQFKNSGWSSYASAMNNWLASDLSNNGNSATWRFAQYHKPMFPHYTGKSENEILFDWWAQEFYNHAMNLVVESDTHMNKLTQALEPNSSGFSSTSTGGTVYVGEGSWGAPARSANDPKSWTIDLASIQQYKVIQVAADQLVVRTAQFDSGAGTLSREQRLADPLALPGNVNWWSANEVGEAMTLVQNSNRLSVIDSGGAGGGDNLISLAATDDTFVASNQAGTNQNGNSDGLLADGSDSTYGEMITLIKFDLNSLPECATTTTAKLEINVTNVSSGEYQVFIANNEWQEATATWNSVDGHNQKGTLIGSFTPSSTGIMSIDLSQSAVLEEWLANGNHGLVISSGGTSNGLDMTSKETGTSPVLKVAYEEGTDCGGGGGNTGPTALQKGVTISGLEGSQGDMLEFYLDVPAAASDLTFTMSGGSGDADLYVKFASAPTTSSYDCRPWKNGNNETCSFSGPGEGRYYVMVHGYSSFSGVALVADYSEAGSGGGGGGDDQALTSGESVSNLAANQGEAVNFYIDVPAAATGLTVSISGGSGDGDLYVKFGSEPTTSSYDCRPWKNGNNETCTFTTVNEGRYFIMVNGYSDFSGLSLVATYNEDTGGGNNGGSLSQADLSGSQGSWQHFPVALPSGISQLTVTISGGSGDADLYVRRGSQSTISNYDCRPWKNGNNENCSFNNPTADTWYISIQGYSSYSGVNLEANWQ